MLGKLQARAAMADREVGLLKWALGALLKFSLELTVVHVLDEVVR
jgi:hypothetical protein